MHPHHPHPHPPPPTPPPSAAGAFGLKDEVQHDAILLLDRAVAAGGQQLLALNAAALVVSCLLISARQGGFWMLEGWLGFKGCCCRGGATVPAAVVYCRPRRRAFRSPRQRCLPRLLHALPTAHRPPPLAPPLQPASLTSGCPPQPSWRLPPGCLPRLWKPPRPLCVPCCRATPRPSLVRARAGCECSAPKLTAPPCLRSRGMFLAPRSHRMLPASSSLRVLLCC